MAEWWNVDQALIWMVMRDPHLVALAAGDARGARRRRTYFFAELECPAEPKGGEAEEDDGMSDTPSVSLIAHLHNGSFRACDVGQNPPSPIETAIFGEYVCALNEVGEPVMSLRTAALPYSWLHINIDADSVREHFPPKAPVDMQDELSALFKHGSDEIPQPTPDPEAGRSTGTQGHEAPRSSEVLRIGLTVKRWLDEHYPNGLPKADRERRARTNVYREIAAYLTAEYGVADPNLDTIAKEARDWDKYR